MDASDETIDHAAEIEELCAAARQLDMTPDEKLTIEFARLALISLNRIANALAGLELLNAEIADRILPEPTVPPLEHEP